MTSQDQSGPEFPGVFMTDVVEDVVLEFDGEEYKLRIKKVSWAQMNRIISGSSSYNAEGVAIFDLDRYYTEYFLRAVVDSPWGKFTKQLIARFSPEFGTALEALVPVPKPNLVGSEDVDGFFDDPSASTSEEEALTPQ